MEKLLYGLLILTSCMFTKGTEKSISTPRRDLKTLFETLPATCTQGAAEVEAQDTVLNSVDYWETAWGRSGASWPRRGSPECWSNRGSICALPDEAHTVCLPGSRRGSTVNAGWALDPDSQPCQPGVFCLYACEPGYYWTQYNQKETSNFDVGHSAHSGHCDGTWNYGTSTHGLYCNKEGVIQKVYPGPICKLGETYVYAENRLDTHVFICQSVFPGHEMFSIPTLIKAGESVMLTTQPKSFWTGPSSSKPTHADFYASFAGADVMEACTKDGISPSGAAMLPYEIGTGVEDNGYIYSTHYLYQQPNSEVSAASVGYVMDLECESKERGVCGPVVYNGGIIKVDVLKRPRSGSTKVKFVFKKLETSKASIYQEPTITYGESPVATPQVNGSPTTEYYYPASENGRKLKGVSLSGHRAFIRNTLSQTIIVCEEELSRGTSVGPGETIRLENQSAFFIGKKSDSTTSCDRSKMPWILHPASESSNRRLQYSYTTNPNTTETTNTIDFSIVLKCTGVSDVCLSSNARSLEVENEEDSNFSVIYIIKALSSADARFNSVSYDWGRFLFGSKQ